jgi:hypothetical protein
MRLYDPITLKRVEVDENNVGISLREGLVPSVTEILDLLNEGPHLTKWQIKNSLEYYEKTGDIIAAIDFRDETSANFGTVCHNLVEAYLQGETYDGEYLPEHVKAIEPMYKWVDENVDSTLFCEKFFADPELGYGGTSDFLVKLKDGELLLGDLKVKKHSAKFPMKATQKYKYQLTAYRNHFRKEFGEMQIGNFLCASPLNKYWNGKPILLPKIYSHKDWSQSFEAVKRLWYEKYEDED